MKLGLTFAILSLSFVIACGSAPFEASHEQPDGSGSGSQGDSGDSQSADGGASNDAHHDSADIVGDDGGDGGIGESGKGNVDTGIDGGLPVEASGPCALACGDFMCGDASVSSAVGQSCGPIWASCPVCQVGAACTGQVGAYPGVTCDGHIIPNG